MQLTQRRVGGSGICVASYHTSQRRGILCPMYNTFTQWTMAVFVCSPWVSNITRRRNTDEAQWSRGTRVLIRTVKRWKIPFKALTVPSAIYSNYVYIRLQSPHVRWWWSPIYSCCTQVPVPVPGGVEEETHTGCLVTHTRHRRPSLHLRAYFSDEKQSCVVVYLSHLFTCRKCLTLITYV